MMMIPDRMLQPPVIPIMYFSERVISSEEKKQTIVLHS